MKNLIKIGKILSIVAIIIAMIGAISSNDIVFVISAILSIPYVGWRIKEEFQPWSNAETE